MAPPVLAIHRPRLRARDDANLVEIEDAIIEHLPPIKTPANANHPQAMFRFYSPFGQPASQDHIMWETQGSDAFRTEERLANSDQGIVLLRQLLRQNIEKVMEGLDPAGVIRDPEHEPIDTTMGRERLLGHVPGAAPVLAVAPSVAPRELVIPRGRLESMG